MRPSWRVLAFCVCLSVCVSVHATNFAILLNGGKGADGDGLCSDDSELMRTIGDGFDPYDFFGEGYAAPVYDPDADGVMGTTTQYRVYDTDADGYVGTTMPYYSLMRERPCVKDWEVNGCDGNCGIKVPIQNNGPDAIKLADIKLYCAQGGGERIGENGVSFFLAVPPLPGVPNVGYIGVGYDAGTRRYQWMHGRVTRGLKRDIGTGVPVRFQGAGRRGAPAAGTRVRKGMQDLKLVSFSGGIAAASPQIVECPADTELALVDPPYLIPPYSQVLVEVNASISDTVRVLVVAEVEATPASSRRSEAPATNASVVVDLVRTSPTDILNMPFLCCVRSVRERARLGKVLVDALGAYERGEIGRTLDFLRFFIQFAQVAECAVVGAETLCLEQAIEAVMAAARMIGEKHGQPAFEEYGEQGDELRRQGQGEAAMMAYRRKYDKHFKGIITQYPATSSW